jgi:hypothetical protein
MNRFAALRNRPGRTVSGLAVALAALGVAAGSGATFTSSSADTSTTFTAGLLTHTNTPSGTLVAAELGGLKPGFGTTGGNSDTADTSSTSPGYGRVVLNNNGNLAGDFTVTATETGTAYAGTNPAAATVCGGPCQPLDDALRVTITKTDSAGGGSVQLYDGLVKNLTGAKLGTADTNNAFSLAAGTTRTYAASFYLPKSAPNAFQGGTARIGLTFEQVQQ